MQKPKRVLGVDPSIRSTGIYTGDKYILLTDHATKTLKSLPIDIREFDRESGKGLTGEDKEAVKTANVYSIINLFEQVLEEVKPDIMAIEAIAFSANGSIDQLAGVNYAMRLAALRRGIEVRVINPTTLKLKVTGNGRATKDDMIALWRDATGLDWTGKIDDIVDAYWLHELCKQ